MDVQPSIILLVAGFLVLASVIASRVSDRFGVPALIVFLCVGMLAGSDGPGGIHFDNAAVSNFVGTLALAFILFSGGIDTNWRMVRPVAGRGAILSTFGVAITAGLLGLFAWKVLGLDPVAGLLLGSIVSSTDAAAVFAVLRSRGVGLKGQLKPLLEFESGSNDPMAVFLTVAMTQLLTQPSFDWTDLFPNLLWNMGFGVAVGLVAGRLTSGLLNRMRLDQEGLYPVLSISIVLLTFGTAESIRGNGYLAVYVCGIMLNSSEFVHKRYVVKFHDGLAWLMQILLFIVLGLLVLPSQLPIVALEALAAAAFLMFVARPAAVAIGLWGSALSWRERALVAWTGLRGAVPIVFATYPMLAGYENSGFIFNIVFFIVVTSVVIQGTLLMPVARLLKVDEPLVSPPKYSLEIERMGQAQGETREVEVLPRMYAVGRSVADIGIPPDVLILLIGRGNGYVVPRGQTIIEPYDTLLLIGEPAALRRAVDMLVSPTVPMRRVVQMEDPLAQLPANTDAKYLSRHVVVVGHGRVGRRICETLANHSVPFVAVDQNREIVEDLRARGFAAVLGDASVPMVLVQAHIARAAVLVIATPDTLRAQRMIEIARRLNAEIEIVARAYSEMEASILRQEQCKVFMWEEELADGMSKYLVDRFRSTGTSTSSQVPSEEDGK